MRVLATLLLIAATPAWADADIAVKRNGVHVAKTIKPGNREDIQPSQWPGFVAVTLSSVPLNRRVLHINVRTLHEIDVRESGVSFTLATAPGEEGTWVTTTFVIPKNILEPEAAIEMFRRAAGG